MCEKYLLLRSAYASSVLCNVVLRRSVMRMRAGQVLRTVALVACHACAVTSRAVYFIVADSHRMWGYHNGRCKCMLHSGAPPVERPNCWNAYSMICLHSSVCKHCHIQCIRNDDGHHIRICISDHFVIKLVHELFVDSGLISILDFDVLFVSNCVVYSHCVAQSLVATRNYVCYFVACINIIWCVRQSRR